MNKHTLIYLFHALFIAPALFYMAYARLNNITLPATVWRLVMTVAVVVGVYHGYEAIRFYNLSRD